MSKKRAVSAATIKRDISEIRRHVADGRLVSATGLLAKYEWGYALAYDLGSGSDLHVQGGISRPTEIMALDTTREVARYAVLRAARDVEVAVKALSDAHDSLDAVLPRASKEHRKGGDHYPDHRPVTKADLERAVAEQMKRMEAGEGVADDDVARRRREYVDRNGAA